MKKYIRKIPILNKTLKRFRPRQIDVLLGLLNNKKNPLCLDIGANTGQTIKYYQDNFQSPEIHSFEPTPKVFEQLQNKYGEMPNVTLHQYALSNESKQTSFYTSSFSQTNSIKKPNLSTYKDINSQLQENLSNLTEISVECRTLDNWYSENLEANTIIDIVKIDTQGTEFEIIAGGLKTLSKVKIIYFEVQYLDFYNDVVPFYEIYKKLYENGFSLYCHLEFHKQGTFREIESNVLFINSKLFSRD